MASALRVGLIGAGGISSAHVQAYQAFPERLELAAVCDIDGERARVRAHEAGVDRVYTDPEQMLAEASIDAVDICTIHDQHAAAAIAAAESGRHVLVEKPMACSMAECRGMVEAADSAGVTLMVAQYQRYMPSHRAAKAAIDAGKLGVIRGVSIHSMQGFPSSGVPAGHWLYDGKRAGGGIVISVAVHGIDLIRYLVGEVASLSAICATAHPHFVNGAEDYAAATLRFENGAVGEVLGTYAAFRAPWFEKFILFGDHGTIHSVTEAGAYIGDAVIASTARSPELQGMADWAGAFSALESHELPSASGFTNQILHFADCCASGEEPLSSGRDNLGTMQIVFGIYEAARTGETLDPRTL